MMQYATFMQCMSICMKMCWNAESRLAHAVTFTVLLWGQHVASYLVKLSSFSQKVLLKVLHIHNRAQVHQHLHVCHSSFDQGAHTKCCICALDCELITSWATCLSCTRSLAVTQTSTQAMTACGVCCNVLLVHMRNSMHETDHCD